MTLIHFPFMKVGGKHSCSNFNRKKKCYLEGDTNRDLNIII